MSFLAIDPTDPKSPFFFLVRLRLVLPPPPLAPATTKSLAADPRVFKTLLLLLLLLLLPLLLALLFPVGTQLSHPLARLRFFTYCGVRLIFFMVLVMASWKLAIPPSWTLSFSRVMEAV